MGEVESRKQVRLTGGHAHITYCALSMMVTVGASAGRPNAKTVQDSRRDNLSASICASRSDSGTISRTVFSKQQ